MSRSNLSGKKLLELWEVNAKHGLYREDGKWYHQLRDFPGVLFDETGYLVFETREDYLENPYLQIKKDLHVPAGISNIPGYVRVTENSQIQELTQAYIEAKQTLFPKRVIYRTERIIRDTILARNVKALYRYKCQICLTAVEVRAPDYFYAEGHHIKPLGTPHNGPDVFENILCLCPNHHVQLDYGAIMLDVSQLFLDERHKINVDYVFYHNNYIYGRG